MKIQRFITVILFLICSLSALADQQKLHPAIQVKPILRDSVKDTSLNASVKATLAAATQYLKKNTAEGSNWDILPERLEKIIGIGVALAGLITSVLAFKSESFMAKYKPLLVGVAIFCFSVVIALLFSGILEAILLAFAIIVVAIFLFLYIFLKYVEFLHGIGIDITSKIIRFFSAGDVRIKQEIPYNPLNEILEKFNTIVIAQAESGNYDLTLKGSFVEGYQTTRFKLIPNLFEAPLYQLIDNGTVIPQNIEVTLHKEGQYPLTLKAIHKNSLVIVNSIDGQLLFQTFNWNEFDKMYADRNKPIIINP